MPSNDLHAYLNASFDRHVAELTDLLKIPSVSTDPGHEADMRAAAGFVRDRLAGLGFSANVRETGGHPLVQAELVSGADRPTILIYGHYDVQPAEPLELWNTPPFEPKLTGAALIARGASDDKGQFYAHIMAVEALLATGGDPGVNIRFLIEGEEEIGSPNLDAYIREHLNELRADAVIISDGAMVAPGVPSLTYGLRGLAYVEVRVTTADRDLHSGAYGGAVPNAINVLARMIAALHDEDGRVTVPGFYDSVLELDDAERGLLARVPFDEAAFLGDVGVRAGMGEAGRSVLERISTRPTLDVNGIGGGFQGAGSKTVIANSAMAKISCRLVPDQDSGDITARLGAWLRELAPTGVKVDVTDLGAGEPAITSLDAPAVKAAAAALHEAWGKEPVFVRTGGSIPVVNTFQQLLGAPVVLLDMGLPSDNVHAPNEQFGLECYRRGIHAAALMIRRMGETD